MKMHSGPGDTTGIYLYTHSGGSGLPDIVRESLVRGEERWGDEAYFARVLFSDLIQGAERELTGFGITTYLTDNEHPIVVVDCEKMTVGFAEPGSEPTTYRSWTFEEFIAAAPDERNEVFQRGSGEEEAEG